MPLASDRPVLSARPSIARRKWYRTKAFNFALGSFVTLACVGWTIRVMAEGRSLTEVVREIRDAFAQANYASLIPIWFLVLIFYWIKAWRWSMLLAPLGKFRTRTLFPPVMIGFAFNNLLPAHLGEIVRVLVFSRTERQPLTPVLTSVILERLLDGTAILTLLGLGLLLTPEMQEPHVRATMLVTAAVVGVVLVGVAVYLIWTKPFVTAFEWCLGRLPLLTAGASQKLARVLEQGATGLASLKQGRLWVGLITTTFAQWMLNVLIIHWSLWSFGIQLSWLVSCIVMGVTALGVVVPSTPGYFGVIQACFLAVLQFFTKDRVGVMAASIYFHMAQWIPVTAIGLFFFLRSGIHLSEVTEESPTSALASATPADDVPLSES